MNKSQNNKIIDSPVLSSLNVVYIHETYKSVDIYQENKGKYHQIRFKVKILRGRRVKRKNTRFVRKQ